MGCLDSVSYSPWHNMIDRRCLCMAVLPGTVLNGHYKVVKVLGEGGMACVYQAVDISTGRRLAVKEMEERFTSVEEKARALEQFRGEAVMLLRLSHPNIPKVLDYFSSGRSHFMVMEFIEGSDLDRHLRQRGSPYPERTVVNWGIELCRVLYYLHVQKPPVIFRDIKPSNIILTPGGKLILLDFGIARIFKAHKSSDTFAMGTEGYAAPEQYLGGGQTDPRSDIYALAATLYHLSTGEVPLFAFPRLKDLSSGLAAVLKKATELDPDIRYGDAKEFRMALMSLSEGDEIRNIPSSRLAVAKGGDRTTYIPEQKHRGEAISVCPRCSAVLRARSRFCIRCGERLS